MAAGVTVRRARVVFGGGAVAARVWAVADSGVGAVSAVARVRVGLAGGASAGASPGVRPARETRGACLTRDAVCTELCPELRAHGVAAQPQCRAHQVASESDRAADRSSSIHILRSGLGGRAYNLAHARWPTDSARESTLPCNRGAGFGAGHRRPGSCCARPDLAGWSPQPVLRRLGALARFAQHIETDVRGAQQRDFSFDRSSERPRAFARAVGGRRVASDA